MTDTKITITIGADTVSNDVKHVEMWQEDSAGVGRFFIDIDNVGGQYNAAFAVNDAVAITFDSAQLMAGNVDSVHPIIDDDPDVYTQLIRVTGRDKGRELVDLTVDKYYVSQVGDDIIDDLLSTAGSNITYTSPSSATALSYDSRDEYLLASLRKITERTGQSFYVDKDGALQLFATGGTASLFTITDDGANKNVLRFERDAAEGTDIKNYIIVRGTDVKDGWSEFNSSDWDVPTNGTVANETTTVTSGVGSIKFTKGLASSSWIQLDFSTATQGAAGLYGRTSMDWSNFTTTVLAGSAVRLHLTDTAGAVIERRWGPTLTSGTWREHTAPVGTDIKPQRLAAAFASNLWKFSSGSSFNWDVEKIRIEGAGAAQFFMDGLTLPEKMFSVKQDATSQSNYGVRQLVVHKNDLASQIEIDAFATDMLAKKKDILVTLEATVEGDAGVSGATNNWQPGKTITVDSSGEGISSVKYRMLKIHHIYDDAIDFDGNDFITELVLTPITTDLDIRRYEALEERVAFLRELREALALLEQEEEPKEPSYPPLPDAIGELYLLNKNQWFRFFELDRSPMSISTATDGVAAGTSTFTDNDATEDLAVKRLAAAANGRMFGSDAIGAPSSGEYVSYLRIKVTSNASSVTVLQFQVYDDDGAANVATLNLAPDAFAANNTYEFFGVRSPLKERNSYRFRGQFTTGITDVTVDWVGVSDVAVAFAVAGLTVDNEDDADNANTTDDNDDAGTTDDADDAGTTDDADDANTTDDNDDANNAGDHTHSPSSNTGVRLPLTIATRFCATTSGGPVTSSFLALRSQRPRPQYGGSRTRPRHASSRT
jgi:hypothetical protein